MNISTVWRGSYLISTFCVVQRRDSERPNSSTCCPEMRMPLYRLTKERSRPASAPATEFDILEPRASQSGLRYRCCAPADVHGFLQLQKYIVWRYKLESLNGIESSNQVCVNMRP
ncbi:uncharacterized protein LOC124293491 isoform X2 [Neodiprion lecontei]|uniref:Uncharacterized protein LOC124293491 isoform X2 n=1 Tax=Neodiprion lecontei TaxID=441921 RepID=A0ABM3FQZ5_NEOLC|nr:uncharacterized protein LOC124293491 isoform X2 [Neodiprion lecontei]